MIKVIRDRQDENGNFIKPSDNWFLKASAATAKAIEEGENHNIDNKIYAHSEVRRALEKLFHHKCAYCESYITATDDWEVEHYRPKGSVAENQNHPGYYWLAYDWTNLYPVCTHCNQRRKDPPMWGESEYGKTGGKADQFPLTKESNRAMSHLGDITKEKPLLLDPCSDDPEKFFKYDITGEILPIRNRKRAKATRDICHLYRKRLNKSREKTIHKVINILKFYSKLKSIGCRDAANEVLELLQRNYFNESNSYAGAARFVMRDPAGFGLEM